MAIILAAVFLLPGCEKIVGKLPPAPPGPPAGALPNGVLQRGYNFVIKVTSTGPPTFRVASGTLPGGISLAIDGTLFGAPTATGRFNFVIEITDNNGVTTAAMTLDIVPALALATSTLPNGFLGLDYLQDLSAIGGIPGYTWENLDPVTDPPGLEITNAGPGNATYSGIPTAPGIYQLNVRITDNGNQAVLPGFVDAVIQIAIAGAPAAYVTNSGDGTVSVIDMSTETLATTIPGVGTNPRGIALSPNGATAFVTNFGSGDVAIIDAINNVVTGRVTVGNGPLGVVMPRGGTTVYVANQNDNSVSVIDTALVPPQVVATIDLSGPFPGAQPKGLEASPTGKFIFLALSNVFDLTGAQPVDVPDKVVVINNNPNDPAFHSIIGLVDVGEGPTDIRFSPSTGLFLVSNEISNQVSILDVDLATPSFSEKIKIDVADGPSALGVGPRCNEVHVSRTAGNSVAPVDVNWEVARAGVTVAAAPRGIGFNPDGNKMYVAQSGTNQVRIVNLDTQGSTAVTVGNAPFAIAAQANPSFRITPLLPKLMPEATFDTEYRSRVCATGAVPPYSFTLLDGELPPGLGMDNRGLVSGTPTDASIPDLPDLWTFGVNATDSAVNPRTLSESLNLRLQVCCLGSPLLMYVANSGDGSVSVIEPSRQTLVTTITTGIGQKPVGVAIRPDGNRVLVTNFDTSTVSYIDSDPNSVNFNTVIAIVTVGLNPTGVAILPNGSKAYVASEGGNQITVINAVNPTFIKTIPVGNSPSGVAVNGDGSRVYVTNIFSNSVTVINTVNDSVVTTISVGGGPVGIDFDVPSNRLYVTNQFNNTVTFIDAGTNAVLGTIPVGNFPTGIIIDDAGNRRAYVANQLEDTVSVIDLNVNKEIDLDPATLAVDRISVGTTPDFLGALGLRIYVSNFGSGNVSRILNAPGSLEDNTVTDTISAGKAPEGVKVQGGR